MSNHASDSHNTAAKVELVIIGAMREEIEAFEAEADLVAFDADGAVPHWTGCIGGLSVAVCQSGIGKVNATMAAQFMISRFRPEGLVFTGVAGGVMNGVGVGEVVIATHAVQHDYDLSMFRGKKGFVPGRASLRDVVPQVAGRVEAAFGRAAIARLEGLEFVEADQRLRGLVFEAIDQLAESGEMDIASHAGVVASGDQFIDSEETRTEIQRSFGALCAEMEGGAAAYTCESNGVPFAIIRSISDTADGGSPSDFNEFMRRAARTSSAIVVRLCRLLHSKGTQSTDASLKFRVARVSDDKEVLVSIVECFKDGFSGVVRSSRPARTLRDWYFDTQDHRLYRRGVSCRVRIEGDGEASLSLRRVIADSKTVLQRESFDRPLRSEEPSGGLREVLERSGVMLSEIEAIAKRCGIRPADFWSIGTIAEIQTDRLELEIDVHGNAVDVRFDRWMPAGDPREASGLVEVVLRDAKDGPDVGRVEKALMSRVAGLEIMMRSKLDLFIRE